MQNSAFWRFQFSETMRQTKGSALLPPFSQLAASLSCTLWEGTISPLLKSSSCALPSCLGQRQRRRESWIPPWETLLPTGPWGCPQLAEAAGSPLHQQRDLLKSLLRDIRGLGGVWRNTSTEVRELEKWGRDAMYPSANWAAALMGTGDETLRKIRAWSIYHSFSSLPGICHFLLSLPFHSCDFFIMFFSRENRPGP